ncbi:hypothetical protein GCM10010168_08350 [Actinoplanes ianthinogenes]|uniref:ABC transporter domain-containing protein n=1 Tax=Actinoplanes ianthinogenes TaxID=122358 RepID=A0ABM7LT44_9ACTN|nr:ABC transporter ATP-binding protein [Actinoplanes ianthinogenes]BCJ42423.1 hypothetical protein Aiant_30800 [Actinoplanes ianthinogenes]GGQ94773.1 hypothetical protein GCM10010168_08350 [Actinoplanes ianthinogenes]
MAVLSATGAGVRHHKRWLVRDLDLTVEAGETVAVVGPPGSGRTSTLLMLARRLRSSAGTVAVSGTAVLAHVAGVTDPEPVFTVLEHVEERLALLGRPRREAGAVPLHGLEPGLRGRELTPYQKQVLGLVLAGLAKPAVIALDGVDAGLDARERGELWGLLGELTAGGLAVLVTAREVDPARVSRVVHLSDPQAAEPGRVVVQSAEEYAATLNGWPFGASAAALREAAPQEAAPQEAAPQEAAPQEAAPHEAAPQEAAPQEAASDVAAPEEAASDVAAPEEAQPESAEPAATEPESTEPDDAEPKSAEPNDAEPNDAEPDDAEPEEELTEELAEKTEKERSGQ